jgi:nicotinamidase-related amidase
MMSSLLTQSTPFLTFLEPWVAGLPALPLRQVLRQPHQAAILSVDVTYGFCNEGALASPRVAAIVRPIVSLFQAAWNLDLRSILLIQDTHEPDAVEFSAWPAHCVRGTPESQPVQEIVALPFFEQLQILPKNSISSNLNTGLDAWIAAHPQVDTFIAVGDCTDLCTYQLAMHLRLQANASQLARRVIVPANCVDTYDRPVEAAAREGGLPHPGPLLQAVFLYHLALNGVEVVASLE